MDYFLDVNVLMALNFDKHPHFDRAQVFVQSLEGLQKLCICRVVQQGFLRLSSTQAVYRSYGLDGNSNMDAIGDLYDMMAFPNVCFVPEPPDIEPLWLKLAARNTASPKIWMDAYLAAFAITADLELVTLDKDFMNYVLEGS